MAPGSQEWKTQVLVEAGHKLQGEVTNQQPLNPAWSTVLKEGKPRPQKRTKVAAQSKSAAQIKSRRERRKMVIIGTGTASYITAVRVFLPLDFLLTLIRTLCVTTYLKSWAIMQKD